MNIEFISRLLESLENNNNNIDRTKICDLNIYCLNYCNQKEITKSRIKLKNIIDFCFSVLLLIDLNKIDSEKIVEIIKVKALYLKLDLLFDVKEDPSGFADMITKLL